MKKSVWHTLTFLVAETLFLVVCFGCSRQSKKSESAKKILLQVSERYKSLEDFEIKATVSSSVENGQQTQEMVFPIYYAKGDSGKLRIEVESNQLGMTLVSDGNETWTYLPSYGQYTLQQASVIQTGNNSRGTPGSSSDFTGMGEQLTKSFEKITEHLKKAQVLKEESITSTDGEAHNTYVIEATYEKSPDMKDITVSPTKYWIDKERYLVLRQKVSLTTPENSQNGKMIMNQTMELQRAHLNPEFTDSTFSFAPPANAQKVEQFAFGGASQGSSFEGKPAIDFTLSSFSGKKVHLDDLKGNVVLLDFWATWCGPCKEAHPHIQRIYNEYKDQGLVVLGINSESKQRVKQYMDSNGYTFTNLMDQDQSVAMNYQVDAIPCVFIINRKGVVSSHLIGFRPESEIRGALKEAGL